MIENGTEFALFMRRSRTKFGTDVKTAGPLLGWEYCGNYVATPDTSDIEMTESALSFSPVSKRLVSKKILASASNDGYGRDRLDYWRDTIDQALKKDRSPPGPKWMVENRIPTDDERKVGQYSLAAQARALGYKRGISDEKLSHIMVNLDEFYTLQPIKFVRYQPRSHIYDYVKGGKTGSDAQGKRCSDTGEPPAKASDWYTFLDTLSY